MENLLEITEKVNKVLRYSQDVEEIDATQLIQQWRQAKKKIIDEYFNGQYIINLGQVEIELTEDVKKKKFDTFLTYVDNHYPQYRGLSYLIANNEHNFFSNILTESFYYDGIQVPSGIKLTKAFKFFVDDSEDLYDIQTEASRIIQEDKIKGELCFSVHPLDYLSSSETTYKWRSCHALNGDFRAGNLSYMLDSSTIVCYIKGEDEAKLPRFPSSVLWNSKKWRMLLFISDDENLLFAGRQYPFFSMPLLKIIRTNWLRLQPWPMYIWSQWHKKQFNFSDFDENNDENFYFPPYIPINRGLYKLQDIIIDASKLHFNDLLYSSVYKPYYMYNTYTGIDNIPHLLVGAQVTCPCCGKELLRDSERMVCDDCYYEYHANEDC
jgi:hypothetical protein